MISHVAGKIILKEIGFVVLDVGGLGYKVRTGITDIGESGEDVSLWTHLAVREDALDLYRFRERHELEFSEDLIKIPGIGPRTAMSMLSLAPTKSIREAIGRGDSGYLTKFAGMGKKTAEKIIIELGDKMPKVGAGEGWREESDALEALVSLGYGKKEASDALRESKGNTGERVKQALRNLGQIKNS